MRTISYNVVKQAGKYWNCMLLSLLCIFYTGNFFFIPEGAAVYFQIRNLRYTEENLKCPASGKQINIRMYDRAILKGYAYCCAECQTQIYMTDLPKIKK